MSHDRSQQLGEDSIRGLLMRFSLPAIVGLMAQALYNLIDRVFVGHALGETGIAAVTVAFPVMLIMLAFGMLIGFGAAALISIRLGEGSRTEAEHILGNAFTLLPVAAMVVTPLGLVFLDPVLGFFGASETVLPLARDYLQIIILGTVFQMVSFGLSATIRGEGNPRMSMYVMLASVILNAILAPLLIFGFTMGMRGAALATVLAQAAAAVGVLAYYFSGASMLKIRLNAMTPDRRLCLAIARLGAPPFMMQLVAAGLQSVLNQQLGYYGGDRAISMMGIIYVVAMMTFMPVFGINQGVQPIISYNHGARRFQRVKQALETAILAAMAVTTLGFVVSMLFPAAIIRLFGQTKPESIAFGVHAMRIAMCMLPIVGFQIVSASYFQAVGKPVQATVLMLSRQLLLLVPAVLILPLLFGLDGMWAALPTADLGASLLTACLLAVEMRRLKAQAAYAGEG